MTKSEYLNNLKAELEKRQVPRIQDILADYEEHFQHAQSKGLAEEDIAAKLGPAATIATAYETESMISKAQNSKSNFHIGLILSSIGRLIIIAPFNVVVMFIPTALTFAFLVAGWGICVGLAGVAMALLGAIPGIATLGTTFWATIAALSGSVGFLGAAALGGLIMFLITKYIAKAFVQYLQWNLKFILEK